MNIKSQKEVIESTIATGQQKVALSSGNYGKLALLSCLAGCYIALGGVLSVVVGYGFPGATAANPSLQRILSGVVFPIGLILVVVLGAELFTGNNALLIPAMVRKHYGIGAVLKNWLLVYIGNFVGSLFFVYLLVYSSGLTAAEPYHSAIIKIAEVKTSMPWLTVFLRGIGANWCVCLAIWLALTGHGLLEKMAGCWLPVMAFVALGYEHSIANMFFIPAGMFEGAAVTPLMMLCNNLVPATLGNIVGGGIFVGCVNSYLHLGKRQQ